MSQKLNTLSARAYSYDFIDNWLSFLTYEIFLSQMLIICNWLWAKIRHTKWYQLLLRQSSKKKNLRKRKKRLNPSNRNLSNQLQLKSRPQNPKLLPSNHKNPHLHHRRQNRENREDVGRDKSRHQLRFKSRLKRQGKKDEGAQPDASCSPHSWRSTIRPPGPPRNHHRFQSQLIYQKNYFVSRFENTAAV